MASDDKQPSFARLAGLGFWVCAVSQIKQEEKFMGPTSENGSNHDQLSEDDDMPPIWLGIALRGYQTNQKLDWRSLAEFLNAHPRKLFPIIPDFVEMGFASIELTDIMCEPEKNLSMKELSVQLFGTIEKGFEISVEKLRKFRFEQLEGWRALGRNVDILVCIRAQKIKHMKCNIPLDFLTACAGLGLEIKLDIALDG